MSNQITPDGASGVKSNVDTKDIYTDQFPFHVDDQERSAITKSLDRVRALLNSSLVSSAILDVGVLFGHLYVQISDSKYDQEVRTVLSDEIKEWNGNITISIPLAGKPGSTAHVKTICKVIES